MAEAGKTRKIYKLGSDCLWSKNQEYRIKLKIGVGGGGDGGGRRILITGALFGKQERSPVQGSRGRI